ncbi:MAG: hypothetical protein Nk1A_8240 [Endomicrobiia bacterium]|nr:MAG: hypothetical protein Nk1A_8240 [Endomicrobiia bacterium]
MNKFPNLTSEEDIFNKVIELDMAQWHFVRKAGKALDKIFGIVINPNHQYNKYYLDTKGEFNIDKFIEDNAEWKNSDGKSWYDLEGMYTEKVLPDGTKVKESEVLQSFVEQIQQIAKTKLNIKQFQDKVFYQYTAEHVTKGGKGIRGKMDIVVVRPGGRVDIYDIKTSTKAARNLDPQISEWDPDKIKATEYQLAIYGRML